LNIDPGHDRGAVIAACLPDFWHVFRVVVFAVLTGRYAALIINGANLLGFTFSIGLAWLRFGREVLPPRGLLAIAPYVVSKYRLCADLVWQKANPVGQDRSRKLEMTRQ
jgi:hypothetical protein